MGEIQNRAGMDRTVGKWLGDIPMEPHLIDDAVDQLQLLIVKVYSHIRSQLCDQVELFCDSFFKLPLLRLLEEDMNKLELSAVDTDGLIRRRDTLQKQATDTAQGLEEVKDCLKILTDFQLKSWSCSI